MFKERWILHKLLVGWLRQEEQRIWAHVRVSSWRADVGRFDSEKESFHIEAEIRGGGGWQPKSKEQSQIQQEDDKEVRCWGRPTVLSCQHHLSGRWVRRRSPCHCCRVQARGTLPADRKPRWWTYCQHRIMACGYFPLSDTCYLIFSPVF